MAKGKNNTPKTRQDKVDQSHKPAPLQAKTEAQKKYLSSLNTNLISLATGHAGSGKSYCASYQAALLLLDNKIEKIIVTRPYAHLGKDAGSVPGDDFLKIYSFVRPMLDTIKRVLGSGKYNYCLEKGIIEVVATEKIQGRSFDEPCVIIADEFQNATKAQAISLVTRLGEGVEFLAICGDPRQSVKGGDNTLDWLCRFFERNQIEGVGITNFTEHDCVRSGIVRDILVAFEKEGGFYSNL